MAKSVNKVILIGNLGKDPEVKYTPGGMAVAKFSLATSFRSKDKNTGEWVDHTDWHNIVVWDKLAGIAGEYLKKGSPVYVEGRLRTRKWQDKSGNDRYTTEIVANEMQMLGGRAGQSSGASQAAPGATRAAASPAHEELADASAAGGAKHDDALDDDIPF